MYYYCVCIFFSYYVTGEERPVHNIIIIFFSIYDCLYKYIFVKIVNNIKGSLAWLKKATMHYGGH